MDTKRNDLHGIVAEFDHPDDLLAACGAAREAGFKQMEAYSPFPVHGLIEALGKKHTKLQWLVGCAGLFGCLGGLTMVWWMLVIDYPLNVGGKPYFGWPMFIPVIFETTILCAALTSAFGMLAINGFPHPYHPLFRVDAFERASSDRFFLCIEAEDPKFDRGSTRQFLQSLNPLSVNDVEP